MVFLGFIQIAIFICFKLYFTKFRLSGKTLGIIWALKVERRAGLSAQALDSDGALVARSSGGCVGLADHGKPGGAYMDGQPATSGPPGGPREHARARSRGIASRDPSSKTVT